MKTTVCFVILASVCSLAAAADPPQRFAVIVGINDYADPAIPDLKYAESDAKAVYDTLTDPKIGRFPKANVTLLLGKQATNDQIKLALQKLWAVGKDDLVIVFYSGHGAKEGKEAFWVTQPARRKYLTATSLSNADIRKFLSNIPSRRMVILLDCCYAASTVKKSLDDPKKLFGDFTGKGRVTIAGSADNQEALEYEDKKAGIFTHFLVQGLRGAADANADGVVVFDELWSHLSKHVRSASVRQGGLHEPVIISEEGYTPRFPLTFNPAVIERQGTAVAKLRTMFDQRRITGAQYDAGRKALSEPALTPAAVARREIFQKLADGKLDAQFLDWVLKKAEADARGRGKPEPLRPGRRVTIAVVPFETLGRVPVRDAGRILAEHLLPYFKHKYDLVDQFKLQTFLDEDALTQTGLMKMAARPSTKSLSKAVKLRGVRLLVVGTISGSPSGRLSVTARLSDWQTGDISGSRVAQIGAENWDSLLRRLPLLSAKLTGTLGEIGPGPSSPELPSLPGGVATLEARIQQLEAVETEFAEGLRTMTARHPRMAFLKRTRTELAGPLAGDIEAKWKELKAADGRLAKYYQPQSPQRQAVIQQMDELRDALAKGVLAEAQADRFVKFAKAKYDAGDYKQAMTWVKHALKFRSGHTGGLALKRRIAQKLTPARITLALGSGVTMQFALIPAGTFRMGSPAGEKNRDDDETQHTVKLTKAFYMGTTEVTQAQWKAMMGATPWSGSKKYARDGAENAASYVSWNDATAFCKKMSARTGKAIRLPTEAEWEYACRAGSTTAYHFGGDARQLDRYAWYDKNAWDKGEKYAHAVGGKLPNGWGLYDMHGNVWEWCQDRYKDKYSSGTVTNPTGPASGSSRVVRGGSWNYLPRFCRSAHRLRLDPGVTYIFLGFRVVVVASSSALD